MKKKSDDLVFSGITPENIQFGCLVFLVLVDCLLWTFFLIDPWLLKFPMEMGLVIPAVAFVTASLATKLTRSAVRNFLLGGAMVALLALAQWLQFLTLEKPENISMWWTAYLLAFPFASAAKDQEYKGLNLVGVASVLLSMVSVFCTVLLVLDILPGFLSKGVLFDREGRLKTLAHPIVSAWMFMLGIAFCVGYFFRTKNRLHRGLLAAAIVLQFWAQSLTNSRAPTLVTCAIIAGAVFFAIFNGSWNRFLTGLLTACVVVAVLFQLSDFVYDKNHDKLAAESVAQQIAAEQAAKADETDEQTAGFWATEAVTEPPVIEAPKPQISNRNSFLDDLSSFTGRTSIWNKVFETMQEHPQYFLWGTSQTEFVLSNGFLAHHTHNAWIQVLFGFGIPALLMSLCFTFLAVRSALWILLSGRTDLWQKTVAMLVGGMVIAGTMEPFLFTAYQSNHFFTVVFMLCIGYLEQWRLQLKQAKAENCTAA